MEIINIEARVFEAMATRFEQFVKRFEALCYRNDKSLQKWLNNQDVCQMLNISKRTLQDYRTEGKVSYHQLGGKILYAESDIEKLLNDNYFPSFE